MVCFLPSQRPIARRGSLITRVNYQCGGMPYVNKAGCEFRRRDTIRKKKNREKTSIFLLEKKVEHYVDYARVLIFGLNIDYVGCQNYS